MSLPIKKSFIFGIIVLLWSFVTYATNANSPRIRLRDHVPAAASSLKAKGSLEADRQLRLAIGLPLRNRAALDALLQQLYEPQSTNYHSFLSAAEFTDQFGPTEEEYQEVIRFVTANGLRVADTHPNRVVLDVEGSAANIEQAFQTSLRKYQHPTDNREFFSPDTDPSVPTALSVVTVEGLSDFVLPKPLSRKAAPLQVRALSGTGPSGFYAGNDFRNAYVPGTALTGAGQSVGLLEFTSYFPADITRYQDTIGLTKYVPLKNVVIGPPPDTSANSEAAVDIELAIAMAPGLSQVVVYQTRFNVSSMLSRIANDNLCKQLSSSWSWSGGPSATIENIFQQMAAQGQSFFQASGDSDAYTGTQTLDNPNQSTAPVDSTNITCVGGTTLSMSGIGTTWGAEKVWNYSSYGPGSANMGSGGGISTYYRIPYWQTNINMDANSGSRVWRNIPDVSIVADSIFVTCDNGSSGGLAGTSCSAPLWAGLCALVNQQSVVQSGKPVGFLNPALYRLATSSSYGTYFHDVTVGNNVGTNTPGLFNAVTGYDLCTGLGTPNGTNLINALAPLPPPAGIGPAMADALPDLNIECGGQVSYTATVTGTSPLSYQWSLDGAILADATNNTLSLTDVRFPNHMVTLVVTNPYGNLTASAQIQVRDTTPPMILRQPQSSTNAVGAFALLSISAQACTTLNYQWFFNDTVLLADQTNASLRLEPLSIADSGNYSVVLSAEGGSTTSSVARLTVQIADPIAITPNVKDVVSNPDGSFSLHLAGAAGCNYILETATNLDSCLNWLPVATNTASTNGFWQFRDTEAIHFQQRFYRLKLAP